MNYKPKVSIIVRCRNNWKLTKSCIDSIEKNTDTSLYRLIVVNDGSTDDTKKELDNKLTTAEPQQVFIHHEKSLGAVSATNSGLDYVFINPTPYILILDNDTEVLENNTSWLDDMINYFEEDESVGAVGATTDKVIGLQHVSRLTDNKEPKYLISFCMMMSLKCAKKVGMWDERFNPGNYEDMDFSIRARRNGFKLKVAKDVFIKHLFHQTFSQIAGDDLLIINERKGLAKWGERIYYEMKR